MAVLQHKELVDFDPNNENHLEALAMLVLHNKQHPAYRFKLDPTYASVYQMLVCRFVEEHLPLSVKNRVAGV